MAHPHLRRSIPAASDTLASSPLELRFFFSEPIELRFTRLQLLGPDSVPGSLGPLLAVPDSLGTVMAVVNAPLSAGRYVVRWQTAGDDGHVVRGEYAFTVLTKDDGAESAASVSASPESASAGMVAADSDTVRAGADVNQPKSGVPRRLIYLGLLAVVGGAVIYGVIRRISRPKDSAQ